MADLRVYPDRLEIALTRAEKVLARRRGDVVVPRDRITSVAITQDPWIWIRGIRAPGSFVPLTLAVGTWKFHGGNDFLLIKGKQRWAVVIDLDPAWDAPDPAKDTGDAQAALTTEEGASDAAAGELEFVRLIVSTSHATRLIEVLRDDADGLDLAGELIG